MKTKPIKINREKLLKQFGGKVPTEAEILDKIKASQERLMQALVGMARTAPDDPEIQRQLREAIEKAAELRKKIYKTVIKEEPPKIHKSSEEIN